MSLFVCSACGTIDNTALAPGYWLRLGLRGITPDTPLLCTICVHGAWHDGFEHRLYDAGRDGSITVVGRLLIPREIVVEPCP